MQPTDRGSTGKNIEGAYYLIRSCVNEPRNTLRKNLLDMGLLQFLVGRGFNSDLVIALSEHINLDGVSGCLP